ncbi:Gfo/Idh/MocA family protein [Paenibacillus eucommiae]|uniref:Dehydrogenase n=1 Tax=Paenibacillus eucommiae TaxID=1355755 RepID=A0ABS4IW46_9BACL|nr:Gfo/Idh/MocA family oxidoreductase [Paenibacillus eucommiae]MBP1991800.1 putative dehydrogenase [Paenibacillus eucommiae]
MGKIRLGLIGTGGVAGLHARQLQELHEEVAITAIADTSAQSRETFTANFGLQDVASFSDYQIMINETELDAVVICSPHTLHYRQASDVLNKGLHVLIEKPMTCSSAEAGQLLAIAKQSGKVMQVSYQRHFQPEFIYIREAIARGEIGKLTSITASLYQGWQQATAGTWRQNPALSGGGFLMDSGSHIIDVLLWTTGLTPVEVKSQLSQQGSDVEMDSFSSIRFEEGPVAGLNLVGNSPCWHETYVFCGDHGGIFYDNGKITLSRFHQETVVPDLPKQVSNSDKSFVEAILGRQEVQVPGAFALKVVQLSEMVYGAAGYKPF